MLRPRPRPRRAGSPRPPPAPRRAWRGPPRWPRAARRGPPRAGSPAAAAPTGVRSSSRSGRIALVCRCRIASSRTRNTTKKESSETARGSLGRPSSRTPPTTARSRSAMRPTIPPSTAPRKAFVERCADQSTRAWAASVFPTASAPPKSAARSAERVEAAQREQPRERERGERHAEDEECVSTEAQRWRPACRFESSDAVRKKWYDRRSHAQRPSHEQEHRASSQPAVQPEAPAQPGEHEDRQGCPEPQVRSRFTKRACQVARALPLRRRTVGRGRAGRQPPRNVSQGSGPGKPA